MEEHSLILVIFHYLLHSISCCPLISLKCTLDNSKYTILDTNQNCIVFFILVCILLFSTLAQDKIYIIFHQDIIHSYICMYII